VSVVNNSNVEQKRAQQLLHSQDVSSQGLWLVATAAASTRHISRVDAAANSSERLPISSNINKQQLQAAVTNSSTKQQHHLLPQVLLQCTTSCRSCCYSGSMAAHAGCATACNPKQHCRTGSVDKRLLFCAVCSNAAASLGQQQTLGQQATD
jgi:hypothetical protein